MRTPTWPETAFQALAPAGLQPALAMGGAPLAARRLRRWKAPPPPPEPTEEMDDDERQLQIALICLSCF